MTVRIDATLRDEWVQAETGWRFDMPAGWMQGRSVFGGLTAAAAVALGTRQVGPQRRLRTSTIQLLRPVSAGETHGHARVLREGKGTAFVEVRLSQPTDEGTIEVAVAQLVFVTPRAGSIELPCTDPPARVDPDTLNDLPYVRGLTPEFTQHAQIRWATGSPPFSSGTEPRFDGYCRFRVPAGDAEGVVALLDLWPSPTLGLLSKPTFSSTVGWTAHVLAVPTRFDGWFQFEYEAPAVRDGFHTVAGRLFAPDGTLVGWTEQLVALYD